MLPYLTHKQKSWGHQISLAGWCLSKSFRKMGFELMASSLRRRGRIFEKWRQFDDVTDGSYCVHRVVFWY